MFSKTKKTGVKFWFVFLINSLALFSSLEKDKNDFEKTIEAGNPLIFFLNNLLIF